MSAPFYQPVAPLGAHPMWTALAALLPALVLLLLMRRTNGLLAAAISLGCAFALACRVWGMPVAQAGQSVLLGMLTGLCPVVWTLLNALWIFNMLEESGGFETLKLSLRAVSRDRRVQTLLVGFGFTALLESIAAFGAPIAIVTSMLISLGFSPALSATIALLADSAPSVWGTQSMPITILASVTDLEIEALGGLVALQAPALSALLPLGLVVLVSGRKGLKGIWPMAMAAGLAYSLTACCMARCVSIYAAGVAAGAMAILATLVCVRLCPPPTVWLFPGEAEAPAPPELSLGRTLQAWSPYIVLIAMVAFMNSAPLKNALGNWGNIDFAWPGLHNRVYIPDPMGGTPVACAAVYRQNWLTTAGSAVFLAGICSIPLLRLRVRQAWACYRRTLGALLVPGGAIVCTLGIAYLMNYAGMTNAIGRALIAVPPALLPGVAVILGQLGCILAGSVASGNALFGNLAATMAGNLGADPAFIAAALCTGGALGKPLTPQNLLMARAAAGRAQTEGPENRKILQFVLALDVLLIVLVTVEYYLLRGA